MSDEKPGREDDARDAELTDEQLDREAPGVDDAGELEAAEDEIAAEAEADEDKVVAAPAAAGGGASPPATTTRTTRSRRPVARRAARSASRRRPRGHRHPVPGRGRAGPRRRRPGRSARIARFLREVVAELRKVIWPGRRELITYTTVVIVFVAFMVALVAGLDLLFAKGVIAVFG